MGHSTRDRGTKLLYQAQPHVITDKHITDFSLKCHRASLFQTQNPFPSYTEWKTSRKKAKNTTIMCHWWAGEFNCTFIILVPVAVGNLREKSCWWCCVSPNPTGENTEEETQPSPINPDSSRTSLLTQNIRSDRAHLTLRRQEILRTAEHPNLCSFYGHDDLLESTNVHVHAKKKHQAAFTSGL